MMRSLWTGASGMKAQQLNVDVISNNIANVNTAGYKKERAEFQSLLYQTLAPATEDVDSGINVPTNMQVGHGVRTVAISRIFDNGSMERTDIDTDFAIEGDGFFAVARGDETLYTRDGSFKVSVDGDSLRLVTTSGYPVLDTNGDPIEIPNEGKITVDDAGNISTNLDGVSTDLGIQFAVYQFQNPQGLLAEGKNLYTASVASGEAMLEIDNEDLPQSNISQGAREMSNISIADEMVNLIIAQRAYELNSKAITTSDEMLQQANNLKR